MSTTGERIKELREKKKLTAEKLAKKLKVTPETVTSWEKGECEPDNKACRDLAIFLSSTPGYIQFGFDNSAQIRTMFPNKTPTAKVEKGPILLMASAMLLFVGIAGIILLLVLTAASADAAGITSYWLYLEEKGFIPSVIVFGATAIVGIILTAVSLAMIIKNKKKAGKSFKDELY